MRIGRRGRSFELVQLYELLQQMTQQSWKDVTGWASFSTPNAR